MRVIAASHPVPKIAPETGDILPEPAEPVDVPEHSYYLRRIAAGELIRLQDETAAPKGKASAKGTAKGDEQ